MLWIYILGTLVVVIGISVFFGAPYVPSHHRDIRRLFDELTPVGEGDVVLDIGSGDGVVLREASRRGARAVGYEIHPLLVWISRALSWGDTHVEIKWTNAWTAPFPDDVTLIYAFAVGRDGKRLARKVQREAERLHRPLTLVCYGNPLPNRDPVRSFEAYHLYLFQ
jgi:SAM-dependent methyltransferase